MDNSELIESFFTSGPGPEQVRAFEKKIESDPAFAEEVAFYLSVHTMAREVSQSEKKQQFRELYVKSQQTETYKMKVSSRTASIQSHRTPVRKLSYYIAAAAVVAGITFGIYTYVQPESPQQMAAKFEQKHLKTLGVTMGGPVDSLQKGLNLYNQNKTDQALIIFEQMCQRNSKDYRAIEYAGLSALHIKEYDKAINYFKKLETFSSLFSNPALFYQAITLMGRSQPGDLDNAKKLLQLVVQKDQEGKLTAQEWLRNWKE